MQDHSPRHRRRVNPTMAAAKSQSMAERDKVLCFAGKVNSASTPALADQAQRYKVTFFNTGASAADYTPFLAKLKSLKPDWVYLNLSGVDQTTFLKQYKEFNLLTRGVMDTVPFWGGRAHTVAKHD